MKITKGFRKLQLRGYGSNFDTLQDHVLVLGERHLRKVLAEYAWHCPGHGTHQALQREPPQRQPSQAVDITARMEGRRSGRLPASAAERGDHVDGPAERGNVGAHYVDAGDLTVLDLGDASLRHAESLGQLRLSQPGRGTHLGQLVPPHVGFPALTGGGLARGLLFAGPRISLLALGLDVTPLGVAAAHRSLASSSASSARCWENLSSASAMATRYQPSQLPALSPATRKIASRLGSNANSSLISLPPDDGGRSPFHFVVAPPLNPFPHSPPLPHPSQPRP